MKALRIYYLAQDLLTIRGMENGAFQFSQTKHKIVSGMDHEDALMLDYLLVTLSGDNGLRISNNCIATGKKKKGFRSAEIDNLRIRFDQRMEVDETEPDPV